MDPFSLYIYSDLSIGNNRFSFFFFIFFLQFFGDHYHFQHHELRKRSVEPSHHHQTRLINDERVRWSQQQRIKSRKKRDYQPYPMLMGKNRVFTTDPKWPQMWYLVSFPFQHQYMYGAFY